MRKRWTVCGRVALLLVVTLASACASSGGRRNAPVAVRDERGFSITEDVRASTEIRARFEQALRLLDREQYESGISLLIEVTEAAPRATTAHIDLGIAYRQVNDLERAEASIKRAVELSPRHPVAHNELGIVYRKAGRFADARASYEKALAVHPDFHYARRNLAILCDVYLAEPRCAIRNYELYTEAVPDDEAVAMWIADLRNRIGE